MAGRAGRGRGRQDANGKLQVRPSMLLETIGFGSPSPTSASYLDPQSCRMKLKSPHCTALHCLPRVVTASARVYVGIAKT